MFDQAPWRGTEQQTWQADEEGEQVRTIRDIKKSEFELIAGLRFLLAFGLGVFFFLVPVSYGGQVTVPFDVITSWITNTYPTLAGLVGFVLILCGGVLSIVATLDGRGVLPIDDTTAETVDLSYWETSFLFLALRVLGVVFAVLLFFEIGPAVLHVDAVGGLVWGKIVLSVAIIIPIGAVFVNLLVELGGLEFIGTLSRPFMRPLFNLPGRAALDSIASWIGAFTVGYYVTHNVFHRGGYHKRDVFIITTCFAPVSIGFVGVVVATVGLLELFPVILLAWVVSILVCGVVLVRLPPLRNVPNEYIVDPDPEPSFTGSATDYVRFAISEAMDKAKSGRMIPASIAGLIDGIKITAGILGTVVAISMVTLLLVTQTDAFRIISIPLAPVISALGIPDSGLVASAILISGIEQVSAAAVVAGADMMARFFVTVVAISQIIFFAASGPMMMDMFKDIPIRFRDLIVLFCLRTAILIPVVAAITHAAHWLGLLA